MNADLIDNIAHAVLYEGYILYPYRPSQKNTQRWTFGGIVPRAYSDSHPSGASSIMQCQCLLRVEPNAKLDVIVRFLHPMLRQIGKFPRPLERWSPRDIPAFETVEMLAVDDHRYHTWQEAAERMIHLDDIDVAALAKQPACRRFQIPGSRAMLPLESNTGEVVGVIVRHQQAISGELEVVAVNIDDRCHRLTARVTNVTPLDDASLLSRDDAMLHSLASTHAVLSVRNGEFLSSIDPPEEYRGAAADCDNVGAWPVLVGEEGATDTMLAAPIILYDYPHVAPESPGDFFDGTEIDEMLSLRVMTLTDDEKRDMQSLDERCSDLLARTEAAARDQLLNLHGTFRK